MPHHRIVGDLSPQPLSNGIPLSKAASGDKVDRYSSKMSNSNGGSCSPSTLDRRSRRFSSSANSRQNLNSHEVPYARLLDSPSRICKTNKTNDVSPTMSVRHQHQMMAYQQQQYHHHQHHHQQQQDALMTPRALRIPCAKTSSSDSKLTADYFQPSSEPSEICVLSGGPIPDEMSHSAPQPHPLESDSDPSLSPKMMSEDEIVREVCCLA